MVGELMILMSLVVQDEELKDNLSKEVTEKLNRIELITEQLQSQILKMRMFPIKSVYDKLKRQVRDLMKKSGKTVNFILEGEETEVDKIVIDEIYSPLNHIMRNSMDHGVETPEIRITKGKSENGMVKVITENRGDNIVISIIDDGAGLNKEKILEKAIKNELITENHTLTDEQIFKLIFQPGFSTAEKVTEISGRGVGMDVVLKSVDKLDGKIEIKSVKDKGSTFEIILPLSSSIIEGLIVKLGNVKLIFPLLKVKHTITPDTLEIKSTFGEKGKFIIFENTTVPIINGSEFYGIKSDYNVNNSVILLFYNLENKLIGITIDDIISRQKVVTKTLGEEFKHLKTIKAAAILGDGSIGFIVEPGNIKNF